MTPNWIQKKKANCVRIVWNLGKIVSAMKTRRTNAAVHFQYSNDGESARLESLERMAVRIFTLASQHHFTRSCYGQQREADDLQWFRNHPGEEPCPGRRNRWHDSDGVYHCTGFLACRGGGSSQTCD